MLVAVVILVALHLVHCANISDSSVTNHVTGNLTVEGITMMMQLQTKSTVASLQIPTKNPFRKHTGRVIRLTSNRTNAVEGRVEVFWEGLWGTVCDDGFNDNAALVVCRMLGYEIQYPMVFHGAYYGQGYGKIWIDNIKCIGNESDIFSCSHNGFGEHNCVHREDVGVNCQPNATNFVRLVHQLSKSQGRVELYRNGYWGTVCDVNFDVSAARVICRTLGFESEQPIVLPGAYYGQGVGEVMANDVRCNGSEPNILSCDVNKNVGIQNCGPDHDVGVNCQPSTKDFVRLMQWTSSSSQGRVELFENGVWSTVCDDGFDVNDAIVICRTLGHDTQEPIVYGGAYYGEGTGDIMLTNFTCNGTETIIHNCGHNFVHVRNCTHKRDAGVNCKPAYSDFVRLINGKIKSEGRLEVFINGSWGSVCDNMFDVNGARVVCRILGYDGEQHIVRRGAYYGAGTGNIWLQDVQCAGTELFLRNCPHKGLVSSDCIHQRDVGVSCQPYYRKLVRLVSSKNATEGRVEVFVNGSWGTVCDDNFDIKDARVICRMLGYEIKQPLFYGSEKYGSGEGKILLDDVFCNGNESNIFVCRHGGLGLHDCGHNEDVGVNCQPNIRDYVRLTHSGQPSEGHVQVFRNDKWETFCDDTFDVSSARVVCRTLGYEIELPIIHRGAYTELGSANFNRIRCNGTESDIFSCIIYSSSCSYIKDIAVNCQPPAKDFVRLVMATSRNSSSGRVEVYRNDSWKTVCDDGFDMNDARVICRMLGFKTEQPVIHTGAYYGAGSGIILMANVSCNGTESSLFDCGHDDPRSRNCSHSQDVGINCQPDTRDYVRLVSSVSDIEGRVEVFINGSWGTICDGDFTVNDARVICRMLGHESKLPLVQTSAYYGAGSGKMTLNVRCNGTEADVRKCSHSTVISENCSHQNDVGVKCVRDYRILVRLVSRSKASEGRVELFLNGSWGTVCDDGFDIKDARVICRMLGYEIEQPILYSAEKYGTGSGKILLDQLNCNGSESNILACDHGGIGIHNCGHYEDVGLNCQPNARDYVRLTYFGNSSEGRLQVHRQGSWGTVCDKGFDASSARVVCRMLGYEIKTPIIHRGAYYGQGTENIYVLTCNDSNSDILNCTQDARSCNHSNDVGVNCQPRARDFVRLVHSRRNSSEGRVEVYRNDSWGTVCDDGFEVTDARVICRMLGFTIEQPIVLHGAYYGAGSGIILMANINCDGTELSLFDCGYDDFRSRNCSHAQDVGINCQPGASDFVRLVNSVNKMEGRVEVFINGTWGTICDGGFTVNDARVICRVLGYESKQPIVQTGAYYGAGSGKMIFNARCNGTEVDIRKCSLSAVMSNNCSHQNDIGVKCHSNYNNSVRLISGTRKSEGRVEVFVHGLWGTVCDDNFDVNDARVVCRMLGYKTYFPLVRNSSWYGLGSGKIWLDDVNCYGNETSILLCKHGGTGLHNCGHSEDVGVDCQPNSNISEGTVRLVSTRHPWEGRLELFFQGSWGTICDDSFGIANARVVCRMLGFERSEPLVRSNSFYGPGNGSILLDDVSCSGLESHITQCGHNGLGNHNCGHGEDVGVNCQPNFTPNCTDVRLVSTQHAWEGRAEVYIDGSWRTVCEKGFDANAARVVCRMLGYEIGEPALFNSLFSGQVSGSVWLSGLNCTGSESNIMDCEHSPLNATTCPHTNDVGINCKPGINEFTFTTPNGLTRPSEGTSVRLVNGGNSENTSKGRVEVFARGSWGTVCDDDFDDNDARVICRMLGFTTVRPVVLLGAAFGQGTGNIWLDDLGCIGYESDVMDCRHNGLGVNNCGHSEDVSIDCLPGITDTNTGVRLAFNGSVTKKSEGRLEVFFNGSWAAVCGNHLSNFAARVVCRMVGFTSTEAMMVLKAHYGLSSGNMLRGTFFCYGYEQNLFDCLMLDYTRNSCDPGDEVGVKCRPTLKDTVRLVSSAGPMEGRVEIFHEGVWDSVCDDYFDVRDARVVCRMLGYETEHPTVHGNAYYGKGIGDIRLDDVNCNGTESNINNCAANVGEHDCDHGEDVGVNCQPQKNIRLTGMFSKGKGLVEVKYGDTWGTVCSHNFDVRDARVICRTLGFNVTSPLIILSALFGDDSAIIWLDDLDCNGTEQSIFDCVANDLGVNNCSHDDDVSIDCHAENATKFDHLTPERTDSTWFIYVGVGIVVVSLLIAVFVIVFLITRKIRGLKLEDETALKSRDKQAVAAEMTVFENKGYDGSKLEDETALLPRDKQANGAEMNVFENEGYIGDV